MGVMSRSTQASSRILVLSLPFSRCSLSTLLTGIHFRAGGRRNSSWAVNQKISRRKRALARLATSSYHHEISYSWCSRGAASRRSIKISALFVLFSVLDMSCPYSHLLYQRTTVVLTSCLLYTLINAVSSHGLVSLPLLDFLQQVPTEKHWLSWSSQNHC
jgi:uncharacterized membrane protein YbaN (DUF454 family)